MDSIPERDIEGLSAKRRPAVWLPLASILGASLIILVLSVVHLVPESPRPPAHTIPHDVRTDALDDVDHRWDASEDDLRRRFVQLEDGGLSITWDRHYGNFRVDATPYTFFSRLGSTETRLFRWTSDRSSFDVVPDSVEARGIARELHDRILRALIRASFPCGMDLSYVRIEHVDVAEAREGVRSTVRVSLIDGERHVLASVDLCLAESHIESGTAFRFRDASPVGFGSDSENPWFHSANLGGVFRPVRRNDSSVVTPLEFLRDPAGLYGIGRG